MELKELEEKARQLGIKPKIGIEKEVLIHAIQIAEGSFPCFGSANTYCDQMSCSFRDDCLPK